MEEKKQIKISLGTAISIFIIVLLVIALVGMWCYYNKVQNRNLNSEYKEWIDEEKGIKLKYPSEWKLTLGNDYMEPIKIQSSEDKNAASVYVYIYKNIIDNANAILEDITKPDYGETTEELNSEEEIVQIEGIEEVESKVQVVSCDDGITKKVKTIVCIKDSMVYIFKFGGEETEYEKYYQDFENILKTVEISDINNKATDNEAKAQAISKLSDKDTIFGIENIEKKAINMK